ncbi:unnamed protein product, partial [Prorocentrum cordatum]
PSRAPFRAFPRQALAGQMGVVMGCHTALLRSDGTAVACGCNSFGQCDLPALVAGLIYLQVAAGGEHTVLLRSDGTVVTCGNNEHRQCDVPPVVAGLSYEQVAAGGGHTVLLRSDGTAVARGKNHHGQCDLPSLIAGLTYVQIVAGGEHTVLLRSDGVAVACGKSQQRQCDLPALVAGLSYVDHLMPTLLLQASFDGESVRFTTLRGEERCRIVVGLATRLSDIYEQLLTEYRSSRFGRGAARVDAVLPGDRRFGGVLAGETVASIFEASPPG